MSSSSIGALLLLPILVVQVSQASSPRARRASSPRGHSPPPAPLKRLSIMAEMKVAEDDPEAAAEMTLSEELKLLRECMVEEGCEKDELMRLDAHIAQLENADHTPTSDICSDYVINPIIGGVMEEKTQSPVPDKAKESIHDLFQKIRHEDNPNRLRKRFFKALKEGMQISKYDLLNVLNDGRFRGLMDDQMDLFLKEFRQGLPTEKDLDTPDYWVSTKLTDDNYMNALLNALSENQPREKFDLDKRKWNQKITEELAKKELETYEMDYDTRTTNLQKYDDSIKILQSKRKLEYLEEIQFSASVAKRNLMLRWTNLETQMNKYMEEAQPFTDQEIKNKKLINYKNIKASEEEIQKYEKQLKKQYSSQDVNGSKDTENKIRNIRRQIAEERQLPLPEPTTAAAAIVIDPTAETLTMDDWLSDQDTGSESDW